MSEMHLNGDEAPAAARSDAAPAMRRSLSRRVRRLLIRIFAPPAVATVVLLAVYLWMATRYWSQQPRLTNNFVAQLNADIEAIPASQRAWPQYRELLRQLDRRLPNEFFEREEYLHSRDPVRLRAVACLENNRALLDRLREVAAMPKLGFVLRDASDPADLEWMKRLVGGGLPAAPSDNPEMLFLQFDYHTPLRHFCQMLLLDAELALEREDEKIVADDLNACLGIADQFLSQPTLYDHLASSDMLFKTCWFLGWALDVNPVLISDERLQALSDRLTAYGGGSFVPRLKSEQMTFEDLVQRLYSDDGQGDGICLVHLMNPVLLGGRRSDWMRDVRAPLASRYFATRHEIAARFHRMLNDVEEGFSKPFWDSYELPNEEALNMTADERRRYVLIHLLLTPISNGYLAWQNALQQRDAMLMVIALSRFLLRDDRWPHDLNELMPTYVSAPPLDRMSGDPLQFQIVDGRPIVYSVGGDGDDDGAVRPAPGILAGCFRWSFVAEASTAVVEAATGQHYGTMSEFGPHTVPSIDGDWILWPPRKPPQLDESGFYGVP